MDRIVKKNLEPFLPASTELQWTGQPQQGFLLRPIDGYYALLFIVFASIFCTHIFNRMQIGISSQDIFSFLLLSLVGFHVFVGRFIYDKWKRAKTYYALSDDQAIILTMLWSRNVKIIPIKNQEKINYRRHNNGTGTIEFAKKFTITSLFTVKLRRSRHREINGFERIEELDHVLKMIEHIKNDT